MDRDRQDDRNEVAPGFGAGPFSFLSFGNLREQDLTHRPIRPCLLGWWVSRGSGTTEEQSSLDENPGGMTSEPGSKIGGLLVLGMEENVRVRKKSEVIPSPLCHYNILLWVAPHLTVKGRTGAKFKEFSDRPNVVGPASGHRGRSLLPPGLLLLPHAQTVWPTEIVYPPGQVHTFVENLFLLYQPPPPTRSPRQGGPEGGVEPLDVRGVDLLARLGVA
jgi:hypothetical protein